MADTTTMINNGRDWYDLFDTSIKIGLGALISGISTYYITKSSHKHEFSKEKFNQKISMLNSASDALEKYFLATHKLIDFLYGMTEKNITNLDKLSENKLNSFTAIDQNYLNEIDNALLAISKFNLLGLKGIANSIYDYDKVILPIRNDLVLTRELKLTSDEILKLLPTLSDKKTSMHKKINKYFDELK